MSTAPVQKYSLHSTEDDDSAAVPSHIMWEGREQNTLGLACNELGSGLPDYSFLFREQ